MSSVEQNEDALQELRERVKGVVTRWKSIYETLSSNPDLWDHNYPALSADQVNEIVSTLAKIFDRSRAPSGYSAGFEVARAVAMTGLPALETHLDHLANQQYQHAKNVVVQLNSLLAASLSVLMTGHSDTEKLAVSAVTTQLLHCQNEANTALASIQRDSKMVGSTHQMLLSRLGQLDEIDNRITKVNSGIAELEARNETLGESLEETEQQRTGIAEGLENLQRHQADVDKLVAKVEQERQTSNKLHEKNIEISDRIEELLPGAASAGLAAGFEMRAAKLVASKRVWACLFLTSVVTMAGIGCWLIKEPIDIANLSAALPRLLVVCPLIWLGWFSGVQYGNTVRLEEDYLFKASTAKAFVGYRDHMEHMKEIDLESADQALSLLSAKTVEVLALEPGRVLGKPTTEVSPASELLKKKKHSAALEDEA